MIDERAERLINRKLDGELTANESLELNRLLIRRPEVRSVMESYLLMDEQAGEAVRAVISAPAAGVSPQDISGWSRPKRQWWYSFGLVSGLAAAITLAVLLSQRAAGLSGISPSESGSVRSAVAARHTPEPMVDYVADTAGIEGPRHETVSLEREVIGVWDYRSNSLYLLEADVARSLTQPVKVTY